MPSRNPFRRLKYDNLEYRGARRALEPVVARGTVRCVRGSDCKFRVMVAGNWLGGFIAPWQPWDLGHDDHHPGRIKGPEHRECNRATSGRRRRTSRKW